MLKNPPNKETLHQLLLPPEEHHGKHQTTQIKVAAQCTYLASVVAAMRLLQLYYPVGLYSSNTLEYFCKPELAS